MSEIISKPSKFDEVADGISFDAKRRKGAEIAAPVSKFDEVVDDLAREETANISSLIYTKLKEDPDVYAKAEKLGKERGLPTDTVLRNLAEIEDSKRLEEVQGLLDASPSLRTWALEDPRRMALADPDDIRKLSTIERLFQYPDQLTQAIPRGTLHAVGTGIKGAAGLARTSGEDRNNEMLSVIGRVDRGEAVPELEDYVGYQHMSEEARAKYKSDLARPSIPLEQTNAFRLGEAFGSVADREFPVAEGWKGSWTAQIGEGLGSTLPFITMAPLGAPGVGASMFAGSMMSAGEALDRAIQKGATEEQVRQALRLGAAPGLTEVAPIEILFSRVPFPYWGKFAQALGKVAATSAAEGGQEGFQQFSQNLIANYVYDPSQSLFEGVAHATVIGAIVGGGLGTVVGTAEVVQQRRFERDVAAARRAAATKVLLDNIAENATDNKMLDRAPDEVKTAVDKMVRGTGAEQVLIPADKLVEYLQSNGIDPYDFGDGLDNWGARLDEASVSGGDMALSMGEYYSRVAKDHHEGLGKYAKMGHLDVTPDEVEAIRTEAEETSAKLLEEAENVTVETDPRNQVFESTKLMLTEVGMEEKAAATQAEVITSFFDTMGQRAGIDPYELFSRYNIQLENHDFTPEAIEAGELAQAGPFRTLAERTLRGNNLSPEELQAIEDHYDNFEDINADLRSGQYAPGEEPDTVRHLTNAIDKAALPQPMELHRAITVAEDNFGEMKGQEFLEQLNAMQIGDEFVDDAFVSTSTGRAVVDDYGPKGTGLPGAILTFRVPAGFPALPIVTSHDNHVMLQRGTRFRLVEKKEENGNFVFEAQLPEGREFFQDTWHGRREALSHAIQNRDLGLHVASNPDTATEVLGYRIFETETGNETGFIHKVVIDDKVFEDESAILDTTDAMDSDAQGFFAEEAVQPRDAHMSLAEFINEGGSADPTDSWHPKVMRAKLRSLIAFTPKDTRFTEEEISKLRNRNQIREYLLSKGIKIIRYKNDYEGVDETSLIILDPSVITEIQRSRPIHQFDFVRPDEDMTKFNEEGDFEAIRDPEAINTVIKEFYQTAWHGSPHIHNKFTTQKIGTGEGAQVYGWGIYFASNKDIAKWYREGLSQRTLAVNGRPFDDWLYGLPGGVQNAILQGDPNIPANTIIDTILSYGEIQRYAMDWSQKNPVGALSKVDLDINRITNNIAVADKAGKDIGRIADATDVRRWKRKLVALNALRDELTAANIEATNMGRLYKVEIPDDTDPWLDWDLPFARQHPKVKEALRQIAKDYTPPPMTREEVNKEATRILTEADQTFSHIAWKGGLDIPPRIFRPGIIYSRKMQEFVDSITDDPRSDEPITYQEAWNAAVQRVLDAIQDPELGTWDIKEAAHPLFVIAEELVNDTQVWDALGRDLADIYTRGIQNRLDNEYGELNKILDRMDVHPDTLLRKVERADTSFVFDPDAITEIQAKLAAIPAHLVDATDEFGLSSDLDSPLIDAMGMLDEVFALVDPSSDPMTPVSEDSINEAIQIIEDAKRSLLLVRKGFVDHPLYKYINAPATGPMATQASFAPEVVELRAAVDALDDAAVDLATFDMKLRDIGADGFFGSEAYFALTGVDADTNITERMFNTDNEQEKASRILSKYGVVGIKFDDGSSRGRADRESHNWVVFEDDLMQIVDYEQRRAQREAVARGSIRFEQGRTLIRLYKTADMSTFLHEAGHFFLEVMSDLALAPNAPQQIRDDWKIIQEEMGFEGRPDTEHHEKWARTFEAYLFEGKAPSLRLRDVFQRVRSWLLVVYRTLRRLGEQPSPEIRGVMDRMLASDEAIEEATAYEEFTPLFETAEALGTQEEWAAYSAAVDQAKGVAQDELSARVLAEKVRQTRSYVANAKREAKALVRERLEQDPVYKAIDFLQRGSDPRHFRLDQRVILDHYGADALAKLPKRTTGTRNSLHPDIAAETLGFESGDQLVRALMSAKPLAQAVEEETARIVKEKYGNPFATAEEMVQEAQVALHSDERAFLLITELKALYAKGGKKVGNAPTRDLEHAAKQAMAGKKIHDASQLQQFLSAERQSAKKAEEAMVNEDYAKAAYHKRQQIFAHYMGKEAKATIREMERIRTYAMRLEKRPPAIDPDYMDQIEAILEQFEFKNVSAKKRQKRQSLLQFVQAEKDAGNIVTVPQKLIDDASKRNWKTLTVEEFRGIRDAIKNIEHLGKLKHKIIVKRRRMQFEAVKQELLAGIQDNSPRRDDPKIRQTVREMIADKLEGLDAALLKIEMVINWMDGGDINGPARRYLWQPIADAEVKANDMYHEYLRKINEAVNTTAKERLRTKITIPEINDTLTVGNIYAVALNTGAYSNLDKLLRGEKWSQQQLDAILSHLNKQDWDNIQGIWNTIDELWPEIASLQRRLTGVVPEKIEHRVVTTPFGEYTGGYYPMVYDHRRGSAAEDRHILTGDQLFDNTFIDPITPHSHTEDRTGFAAPVSLDLNVVPRHLIQVIHDLSHRAAIRDVYKLLKDPDIRSAIDGTMGRQYAVQFTPWLRNIANDRLPDNGQVHLSNVITKLRINGTLVGLGYRLTPIVAQFAGWGPSLSMVKMRHFAKGLRSSVAHPVESWEFVQNRSGEMRHRSKNIQRDLRDGIRSLKWDGGNLDNARRFAYYGIGIADRMVSVPTWLGAYYQHMDAHPMDEEGAVAFADRVVRISQGTGSPKDLAAVQRQNDLFKLVTMFYTPFSALYSQTRNLTKDTRRARVQDVPHLLARAFFIFTVPALLSEFLTARGPEEDDDWASWAVLETLLYPINALPLARDVGSVLSGRAREYRLSPVENFPSTVINAFRAAGDLVEGDDDADRKLVKSMLEVSGYLFGLPVGQVASSVNQFWEGIDDGNVNLLNVVFGRKIVE